MAIIKRMTKSGYHAVEGFYKFTTFLENISLFLENMAYTTCHMKAMALISINFLYDLV